VNLALIDSAIALHPHEESRDVLTSFRDQYEVMQDRLNELTLSKCDVPQEWGLTGSLATIARLLASREFVTKSAVYNELYAHRIDDAPMDKIIDVFIYKLRRKLEPFGVTIITRWGYGWYVEGGGRKILRAGFGLETSS
jgi:two-component system cell cycle response regulator CtrA